MKLRIMAGLAVVGVALVTSACGHPLITAAQSGDVKAVQALLNQGVKPDEKDRDMTQLDRDRTGLHWAALGGHTRVMEILLDRGAEINARTSLGKTPLQLAARGGKLKAVQLLLDRGADLNAKDQEGWTALHEAASGGYQQVARLLLERGALPGEQDNAGVTPGGLARQRGNTVLAELLEEAEAGRLPKVSQPTQAGGNIQTPASDVDTPPIGLKAERNRYAVVIGIEQYRNKLPKADFSTHDAKIMGAYLTKTMGFAEENVAILMNENATRTDLEKYVEHWLPNRVEKDSTVFVYYSGHGAPNPKTGDAYLVPYDGDPAFVNATGYPLKRLYENLGKLPAKEVVVLLDSCFSGAGGRSVIAKGVRPMVLSVENPVLASGRTVVLAASKGDQVSSTYDQKGHGLLTYFFLKGLRGEADANKDGSVDLAEVYEYLKPQVERTARREFNNDQTPQLLGGPGLSAKGVRLVERSGQTKP